MCIAANLAGFLAQESKLGVSFFKILSKNPTSKASKDEEEIYDVSTTML